jgi:hypothetical protein
MAQRENMASGLRLTVARRRLSVATDASVAFERGAGRTGPRLSLRQTRALKASNASVAEEVDRWISVAGTHGTLGATDATVQRLSPPKIVQ